jgi:hypothetical protein
MNQSSNAPPPPVFADAGVAAGVVEAEVVTVVTMPIGVILRMAALPVSAT